MGSRGKRDGAGEGRAARGQYNGRRDRLRGSGDPGIGGSQGDRSRGLPLFDDLIDIGVSALLVFQTTAAGMDAPSIARDFGGRLAFYGGMDIQPLLSFGSPAEVAATVASNARAFAKHGGYIVANSHHGVGTIRGENIEAMCQAAREYRGQ